MFDYHGRIVRLQELLRQADVDAAILGATDHMRYLCGWSEPAGERFMALVVPQQGEPALIVPTLYRDQARAGVREGLRVDAYHDNEGWHKALCSALGEPDARSIAVDDDLPSGHLLAMQTLLPRAGWKPAGQLMRLLRGVKSPEEIAALERSAAMADRVYEALLPMLKPGVEEREVQDAILRRFAEEGAETAWSIVAFGPNSAYPHHRTSRFRLEPGMVVVLDLGGGLDGYQSDITRTVAIGSAPSDAERLYRIVYEAHMAAMRAAKPGMPAREVDAAARAVIERAGYGQYFIHRTGHGIGLSVHEPPNLSGDDETVLRTGMCFSDEPGIYLEGRFGVRIENIIVIEEAGARSLNAPPPPELPILEV